MPCEVYGGKDENGNSFIGIMCSRGKSKLCRYCGKPMTSLCDYPIGNGKTCGRPMCDKCKTTIGGNIDVCREHRSSDDIAKTLKNSTSGRFLPS